MSQITHGPHLLQRLRVVAPWLAADLPAGEGLHLLTSIDAEVIPPESVLLERGAPADHALLVVDGELQVTEWRGEDALETHVRSPGTVVGLEALVLPGPSPRSVQTRGRAIVVRLTPELYLGALTRSLLLGGRLAARAARQLTRRMRAMTEELAQRACSTNPLPPPDEDTPVPGVMAPHESTHGTWRADRHLLLATFDEMGLFRRVARGRPDLAEALRSDLETVAWPMELRARLHDEVLQAQGAPPGALHVVLAGTARREVHCAGSDGTISLKALHPGDVFGQTALCDGQGAAAEVRALGACAVASLYAEPTTRILEQAEHGLSSAVRLTDWMASQIAADLAFVREEWKQGAAL
ncbi:MAG: cyclic nucleotide-binding domain-containing protein [Planctomycetota bacterium]